MLMVVNEAADMSRNRTSKFEAPGSFKCDCCGYETGKSANYHRHLASDRHLRVLNFSNQINCEINENDLCTDSASTQPIDMIVDGATVDCQTSYGTDNYDQDFEEEEEEDEAVEDNDEQEYYEEQSHDARIDTEWFPFDSKIHFLLTSLYSSKTHRVSDEVMTFVMYIMKECGCRNVPPLSKIKKYLQTKMEMEDMIQKHEDKDGNISWMIKPTSMLKLQLANPVLSNQIFRYPTVETSSQSNYQVSGSKWKEMEFHWTINSKKHQFVKGQFISFELDGQEVYGKILQFLESVQEDKLMYAKVDVFIGKEHRYMSEMNMEDKCLVKYGQLHMVSLEECKGVSIPSDTSLMELINGELINISRERKDAILKQSSLYTGLPVITVPLNLFMDDMSANQSKRWSPLHAIQGQLSGLSVEEKNRGKNVFLLGVADRMNILELVSPICQDIENCKQSGIEAFDASLNQKVILTTDISLIVTDYQMMSLACNHLGPSANKYCPKCNADGTDPFKKWDLRTPETTKRTLERLKLVRDKVSLQRQTGVKLYENCLWQFMDPHRDTPVGTLHFLYLGLAKHLIKYCLDTLNENQKNLLEKHLESIDQSDFAYQINTSFFKYFDSRQGKDFKHYLQIAVINMEYAGLRTKYILVLEKLALISKYILQGCGVPKIKSEFEDYFLLIQENIPEIGTKRKTHLCVHLADDMERHGHLLHYTEDSFEKNHKTIRSSIAHQNGHARSRDTASQFANSELMSHVIAGGFFLNSTQWSCASDLVISYGKDGKLLKFLGMPNNHDKGVGLLKNIVNKKMSPDDLMYIEVQVLQAILNCGGSPNILSSKDLTVQEFSKGTTKLGENARVGSFVLYLDEEENAKIGKVTKFLRLVWKGNCHQVVYIQKVIPAHHSNARLQYITTTETTDCVKLVKLQSLIHTVHDCRGGNCHLKEGTVTKRIEQENRSVKRTYLKHSLQHNVYIINKYRLTHSLDKFVF
ncbi:uncharacterized protein LOC143084835 [Mytilus galloprovincialis]|uniref:uncharacterized protein LOC143084835 n=1 Tax=Mytilus galloprovincialis TaxID=29158 RepID=UPI003F7CA5A1